MQKAQPELYIAKLTQCSFTIYLPGFLSSLGAMFKIFRGDLLFTIAATIITLRKM